MTLPQNTQNALDNGAAGIKVIPETGAVMMVGIDAVTLCRLIAIKHALAFEIKTGMKMSRVSALAAARQATGENFRTKVQALMFLETLLPSDPE